MSESKSLVDLVRELTEIERQIIEGDGALPPETEQMFDLTHGEIATKVDRYKHVIDALEMRAMHFKAMADEATAARRTFENHRQRLRENLKFAIKSMDTDEVCGHDWRYKLSTLKPRLVIDESQLPRDWFIHETIVQSSPDKEGILKAMQLGEEIPGCTLESSEQLRSYVNHAGRAREVGGKNA